MTVQTTPSIEEMTVTQKLQLMEALWQDLTRPPEHFDPPEWHREVLEERQRAVQNGETEYIDWDDAKKQLRKLLK
jgi:hypothetical protein